MQDTSTVANVNRTIAGEALQRGFVVGYALLPSGHLKPLSQSDTLSYHLAKIL